MDPLEDLEEVLPLDHSNPNINKKLIKFSIHLNNVSFPFMKTLVANYQTKILKEELKHSNLNITFKRKSTITIKLLMGNNLTIRHSNIYDIQNSTSRTTLPIERYLTSNTFNIEHLFKVISKFLHLMSNILLKETFRIYLLISR